MAQAARRYYASEGTAAKQARVARPQRQARPDVRVIPGKRSENPALQGVSPQFISVFKTVIVVIAVLAVVCAVRVWLSVGTVSMLQNTTKLESTLTSAQATTDELEIQHSILASPARIEEAAANLGMVAPSSVKYIKVVIPGKIMYYENGSISLADTLHNVEEYGALHTA